MQTQNTMAPSYIQKSSLLKTRESHSSLVWLMDVQRLHENGNWMLCFSNRAKWLSVRLQTKWLWNQFLLQLLKFQMWRVCDIIRTHNEKNFCQSTLFYKIISFTADLRHLRFSMVEQLLLHGGTTSVAPIKIWIRKKFPVFPVSRLQHLSLSRNL